MADIAPLAPKGFWAHGDAMETIQLPLNLIKRVDRLAARKGCSRGALIAAALSIGLRDEERHQDVVDALDHIDEAIIKGDRS